MTGSAPESPALPADLTAALDAFAAHPTVLVALDFDGTLAPLVDDPEAVQADPAALAAVRALERLPRVSVAIVSGRPLASLLRFVRPADDTLLVGSHGAELRIRGEITHPELDGGQRDLLARLGTELDGLAGRLPGTHVERKPVSVVFHTRRASAADAARAGEVLSRLSALPGVFHRPGKDVAEFSVVDADKGRGLDVLRRTTGAGAVFYAGDDATDEDAFAVLRPGDLGVKVGPGETRAHHRVADPAQVAVLLDALARRLAA